MKKKFDFTAEMAKTEAIKSTPTMCKNLPS